MRDMCVFRSQFRRAAPRNWPPPSGGSERSEFGGRFMQFRRAAPRNWPPPSGGSERSEFGGRFMQFRRAAPRNCPPPSGGSERSEFGGRFMLGDDAKDFAADATCARLAVGHHAARRRHDGDAEPVHHAWNVVLALVD